jgi:AcrR family transcriptional regulator
MATRESLLEVTARLYAEHGWRGTTTRKIAEEAGVNEVTLFRQFGSKESLLLEAIESASSGPGFPELPDLPVDPATELESWARAHHAIVVRNRGIIRACLAESEERPALAPAACDAGRRAHEDAVRYLTLARERCLIGNDGSIAAGAMMLINAVFMDAITGDLGKSFVSYPPAETIHDFVAHTLRGFGAKGPA